MKAWDVYIWVDYGDGSPHTEVLSMGLQQMFNDPVAFAAVDPEHFDLIFRFLRGNLGSP